MRFYDLPLPPSVNQLFFNRKKGRSRTERYNTWLNAAGWDLKLQKPEHITGPVHITILVSETSKADLANHEKAAVDLLVKHQVIEDDGPAYVRGVTLQWASDIPNGIRVYVQPIEQREAA